MIKFSSHVKPLSLIFTGLLLIGCGGGSSSEPPAIVTPPATIAPAPPPEPVAERFIDKVFDNVDRTSDIVFGSGARSNGSQTLEMDIYTPRGDTQTDRPVLILAFGGGFTTGFRRDPLISTIAIDFAQRGFVTASICLLYTSPSPRDGLLSRMPSSA